MMLFFLIGKPLGHSFSADYFNRKFKEEGINARYSLEELDSINKLPSLIEKYGKQLRGFNVTAPYKQSVMRFLDSMTDAALTAGSVNCVRLEDDGKMTGHNSDVVGFSKLLTSNAPWPLEGKKALILGGGGVIGAVIASLSEHGITSKIMTRNPAKVHERYPGLKNEVLLLDRQAKDAILDADIIVNCTPLGTAPDTNKTPDIPYEYIQPRQLCLDLVYNPSNTLFSRLCAAHGARTATGLQMLIRQAEDAWKFWMKQGV